jgi:Holliday junction DNA helicase RuvA
MIDYIKGDLVELTPTQAVIDAMGIGYALNISLQTYSAIQGKSEIKLYVYEQIREDAWVFYGFSTKTERELFLMLITVSGVGGNTARMILSSFSPVELSQIIMAGNEHLLKGIKGIGLKTAQRIIVELKDKLQNSPLADDENHIGKTAGNIDNEKQEEAVAALTMLGFAPAPSKKVVLKILDQDPQTPVETIVKLALKML